MTKMEKQKKTNLEIAIEQYEYLLVLEQVIIILPKEPPKDWKNVSFNKKARRYIKRIQKRLEVFNEW